MTSASPLKVALLLESDGPGGAEWMLLHLATELRKRGHLVLPVGPENGAGWLAAEFRKRSFDPVTFRLNRPIDPGCVQQLYRLVREHGVQIVHSHEFTMAVYGAAAAALSGIPHIVTMHGGMHYALRSRRRVAMRWSFRRSAHYVAVSKSTRDRMSESLGIPADSVEVIWNGVPDRGPVDGGAFRQELNLQKHDILAVAVGNLYPVKGHIYLAEALSLLTRTAPDLSIHIAVAGRGEERDRLESYLREHNLGGRFHLLGFRDDIDAILGAADIYVMPSLSEGLPLALAEAMLAAKPVVVTNVGGIPEVITSGKTGLLVDPADARGLATSLEVLVRDPERRRSLGAAARRFAKGELTTATMAERYIRLYRQAESRNRS